MQDENDPSSEQADLNEEKRQFAFVAEINNHPVLNERQDTEANDTSQTDAEDCAEEDHSQVGLSQNQSDQIEIERYQKVIEANPQNHRAWDALGKLFRVLGRHSEAVNAFEKAVALAANQVDYQYNLGLAFAAVEQYDEAVASLLKAVQINPEFSLAHATLAGYYKRLDQDEKAEEEIRIARSLMKNESEYNRACFAAICGENQDAVNLLRVALENNQTSIAWVAQDPDLDFIRDDPEFQVLLKEAEPAI